MVRSEWPLIGRASELQRIRRQLGDPRRHGVVLAGAAGVGKTRLATDCLRAAHRSGCATARVLATRSAAGLPFGAVAPLLPTLRNDGVGAAEDRTELLRRCSQALVERAGGRRLVLLVDDAHLLDDASATLVHQLAASRAAFVLATVRTGAPAPDAVVALWKDGLTERIELGELSRETVEAVLSAALGGLVDGATATNLAFRCQGNMLFLRELVNGAIQDGSLRNEGGIWRLVGVLAPSQRLVELVESRLVGLDDTERSLLELVSVGEPLGPAELAALGDLEVADLLERKGLLSSERNGRRLQIRLAHPLHGEVIRARIPAMRARAMARSLAEAVEATGARRREDVLRVATWRLEGGGGSPELMLTAARTAHSSNDFPLAEQLARAAADAGTGFEAALLAAQLAGLQGRGAEAETTLAALAERAADDAERVFIAIARLDNSALFRGQVDEGLRVAEKAEAEVTTPALRDELAAKRSTVLLGVKGPDAALAVAEPLLSRAEGRTLVWACAATAFGLGRRGSVEQALAVAERGYQANRSLPRPVEWRPWFHLVHRCEALTLAGWLGEADELAGAQYQLSLEERSPEAQAIFAWQRSIIALDRGRVKTAARFAREALALFHQLDRPQFEQFCLMHLAWALALSDRAAEADRALTSLDALELPPVLYVRVDLLRARAWTAVAGGDLPAACALLREGVVLGREIGDRVGESAALHDMARLGHARDTTQRLRELASTIEGPLITARAAHADALDADDPEALDAAAARFESVGCLLLAAEAVCDAATAWRRAGRARAASAAELRADGLAARCEGATTPAVRGMSNRARLTPAEYEAAVRAAAGTSNRDIAGELCLSVRTVENRLLQVYRKLGVGGRSALPDALRSLPGPTGAAGRTGAVGGAGAGTRA